MTPIHEMTRDECYHSLMIDVAGTCSFADCIRRAYVWLRLEELGSGASWASSREWMEHAEKAISRGCTTAAEYQRRLDTLHHLRILVELQT